MRIVLVHSSGLGPSQWKRILPLLELETIAPALTGYEGVSVPPDATWQSDLRILQRIVRSDDIVFGHSYGGFLALQLALRTPLAGLLIHEPAAIGVIDHSEFHTSGFFDLPAGGYTDWVPRLVQWWNGPQAWEGLHNKARAPFLNNANKIYTEVWSICQDRTPAKDYAKIKVPSILSWGSNSRPEAVAMASRIANAIPNGESIPLDGVGHMAPVTHPHLFPPLIETLRRRMSKTLPRD